MKRIGHFLNTSRWCIAGLIIACLSFTTLADEQRGDEIAQARKTADTGWGDTEAEMRMILRNAQGQESERKMRVKSLEVIDDGDKALTIFDQPRDVSGTAFLSFSKAVGADDQWIYLPALKRVKRINSRNKSGPFMGSEFAFEDMTSFELEKYRFNYLRDETLDGAETYVVEQVPIDEYSGYTRQVVWVDKEHYYVRKIEFYDRKDSLLKTLELDDYRQYKDQYWRAHRSEMFNEQTGKSTVLIVDELVFDTGLSDDDFDENKLRNVR
ncbi:outer membrane lipoprotein-sorting protein [Alteromonas oceanisediminis]|uniref:outer membrane lipoprotein-sorting protein n=1 Tax=Alteromonas oceanisediminis TaxID=2836180 RepID=UPI001BD99384|nr:outer membrane lipoprotein-sorting protein [Alteromonas oceanisediminis]MBT0585645.1 outer membrane lipoprotein-sorting protein [Alteromonas oceanisediminis]